MPAAPVLVVAAGATGVSAAVGATVATAIGVGTVSTAVATAIGSGVISAGITAAMGGDAGDILKSAVISGGASLIGGFAGRATQTALASSTSRAVSNSVSAAAAGGASSAVGALAYGANPKQALEAGLKGAAVGGLTQAGVEAAKGIAAQGPRQAGEARLKVPAQGQYERGGQIATSPTPGGFTSRVPTGGGEGLVAPSGALYSSVFAPSQPMRATESGGVQPAYQRAQSLLTPESLSAYSGAYREGREFIPPALTRSQESLLREALELGLSNVFTRQPQTQTIAEGAGPTTITRQVGPTQTTASPGSQALAQALRVGDIGAPIFGGDKETGRRSGWNVESLRYMGDTGEA